jgi:hypothetical protein
VDTFMETPEEGRRDPPTNKDRRRAARQRWLARAGTVHAHVGDVSSEKNRHVAEIYAMNP